MARKNVEEPQVSAPPDEDDADFDYREKPISGEADEQEGETDSGTLTPEQREQKRLARRPNIDHLQDGTAVLDDGSVLPLFDVGDRIIAERHISFLAGHPWLDTRVYLVRSIDDETGAVHCFDEEFSHYACVGFRHPWTRIKLCPKKGNPFKAPKAEKPRQNDGVEQQAGAKKRGRPKGSKNRPKEVIEAERRERKSK